MRLLLLLSALLSSLVGARSGARGLAVPAAVTQAAARCAAACVAKLGGVRPVGGLPSLATVAGVLPRRAFAIEPGQPIFAGRRRE